ncbi:AmmeMemoRadiSam system radical SAM enzyme [candidate division TA06 bacterium]|uniref:AmmeMemoRadiSam system radical SAM enzyme n=1 Tax=candidate division TA06 bacterium TaxID=2250710 RepID=A0A933I958_UNCT6|nr:AmmeMemoRadiSam system radical SAM enzyme [candidate division TA06 bacterium]
MTVEARHYQKLENGTVQCLLCPHRCRIDPGKAGLCRVRQNTGGRLEAQSYGRAVSLSLDPVEKKPLYHFYPDRKILSTGPNGCNLACSFCQNWEISQQETPTEAVEPHQLVELAVKEGSVGIAFTYTEPLIWFEYLMDVCPLARQAGLKTALVTNGTISPEPLKELLPQIDAMNVDLKSMDEGFYRKVCRGDLKTVLQTIELARRSCHVELTNLVIPGLNDSPKDMEALIDWVCKLDPLMPLHLSRYFPRYHLETPPTPEKTLKKFYDLAKSRLKYVYVGNIQIEGTEDTCCPGCGHILIKRAGYRINLEGIKAGACQNCGRRADIIGLND